MAETVASKIQEIHQQVLELTRQYTTLARENAQLKQALQEASLHKEQSVAAAESLQRQLDITKYTQTQMLPEERKAFEKRLTNYIKEIEKCIALLNA